MSHAPTTPATYRTPPPRPRTTPAPAPAPTRRNVLRPVIAVLLAAGIVFPTVTALTADTATPAPAPVHVTKVPCAGVAVYVNDGTATPCDVTPPQRLHVVMEDTATVKDCRDLGGTLHDNVCTNVDY